MDLPLNADAGAILGIKILSPGENVSKNPNCKEKNIGDYCFQNNTNFTLTIHLSDVKTTFYDCTLQPGQKQCFYDIPNGAAKYEISEYKAPGNTITVSTGAVFYPAGTKPPAVPKTYNASGSLYVDVCKEKTFIIK